MRTTPSGPLVEFDPVVESFKGGIDRTLLRENLKLSYEERLLKLMQLQQFAKELRHQGVRARPSRA